jgi:phosphomannomutase
MKKHICLFDMDGTLTEPRKKIKKDMINSLKLLSQHMEIGIVTGSDYDYVTQQCFDMFDIGGVDPAKVHLFPCNGTKEYRWSGSRFNLVSNVDMINAIGQEAYSKILKALISNQLIITIAHDLPYTGTFFQYRGSLLNWCPIGRSAGDDERKIWVAMDESQKIRDHWIDNLKEMFGDYELDITVALGGSTSFDIYPNGWDKTYVLRHLEAFQNVYFVGDRCKEGGNDKALYDVLAKNNTSFETESTEQTMQIIKNIINENKNG